MGKNNLKVMTKEEIDQLNARYEFEVEADKIFVKVKGYNRTTVHPRGVQFSLNSKVRKLAIEPEAVDMWVSSFKDTRSLFEVQNAINILVILYQKPTVEDVKMIFERGDTKIREI